MIKNAIASHPQQRCRRLASCVSCFLMLPCHTPYLSCIPLSTTTEGTGAMEQVFGKLVRVPVSVLQEGGYGRKDNS